MTALSDQIDAFKARHRRFADAVTKYNNRNCEQADDLQVTDLQNIIHPDLLPPIPQEEFAAASEIAFPTTIMNKIDAIQRAVLREFPNITIADLKSARKTAVCVRPRQIAMYLAKQMTGGSMPNIGRRFGGRDHTTVIHAVRKITLLVENDPAVAALVANIKASVQEVGIC